MDDSKTLAILSALAHGVNPSTGEVFAPDSPYQQADVVRALFAAIDCVKLAEPASSKLKLRARADVPANVGKPWCDEDDQRLLAEFDGGRAPADIARDLGRTLAGIEARLEKHGRLSASERKTANRYSRLAASG